MEMPQKREVAVILRIMIIGDHKITDMLQSKKSNLEVTAKIDKANKICYEFDIET